MSAHRIEWSPVARVSHPDVAVVIAAADGLAVNLAGTAVQESVADTLRRLQFDPDSAPTCESRLHRDLGLSWHPAHWWAVAPCGEIDAMCERRRLEFLDHKSWRCFPGCKELHYPGDILWVPVEEQP